MFICVSASGLMATAQLGPIAEDYRLSGTTIMGGDTVIGAGSTIGANVFLTHSVPPRSLVFYEEKQLQILDKDRRGDAALDWEI